MARKTTIMIATVIFALSGALGDVPPQRLHKPDVPYLLQSMGFQTVQMRIFDPRVSGMVVDPYSDLQWNPAFSLGEGGKSIYLDFNPQLNVPVFMIPRYTMYSDYYRYSTAYEVIPRWYPRTMVNTVDTSPIYNVAALAAFDSGISVGFINRSTFDYGPFRSAYGGYSILDERGDFLVAPVGGIPSGLEPQRLEVDNNQQTVMGTQSELSIGYKVSDILWLGVRLGQFIYDRDGTLYDSKWATYPHSSFANLEDESLNIEGGHKEIGLGVLFRPGIGTRLGFYGGYTGGDGSEKIASLDTSHTWWEKDTDTRYYRIRKFSLESQESYSSNGRRPSLTVTLERDISPKLQLRSFLRGSRETADVSGTVASSDTSFGDETYDTWRSGVKHFQRRESHGSRESHLDGSGEEKEENWRWFISLIYGSGQNWSGFAGVLIDYNLFDQEYNESSDYRSHRWESYTLFDEVEYRNLYLHEKRYLVTRRQERWDLFLPIGIRANVGSGLSVILGTDLTLTLVDEESKGRLLYP
ncbi:MAG: hypothetical protein ACE5LH_09525, partial [Fidelibacterota bacterium]